MHHARGLRRLLESDSNSEKMPGQQIDDLIASLQDDFQNALIDLADHAMLEYSAKLTMEPQSVVEVDVQRLRDAGFNDLAIHDLACCVGYFAFVNRIADGLGVELESSVK